MPARYPHIDPYAAGMLAVTNGYELYWETVGKPDGLPAVWLHGGPGGGSGVGSRRNFDPAAYRAVLFDQRGCGRGRPSAGDVAADLSTNTTWHLVDDIERLRAHLGIDRWVIAGASWGVTLALVYAQRHPDRVVAMVLGAVTSGRRLETEWITRDMGRVFPREWDRFVAALPESERDGDLSAAYARLLASPDPDVRFTAAQEWCRWEDVHVSLVPGWTPRSEYDDPAFRMTFARLVTHYWSNGCFLDDHSVLDNTPTIAHIPATLIHGRYDVSGPLDTAWQLHRRWPSSRLIVVDDAGHGGGSFTNEIVAALDEYRSLR
jgi:proline iminopeptidase